MLKINGKSFPEESAGKIYAITVFLLLGLLSLQKK